ncbi:MAG: CAP domain-containing protein [bacterium]
MRILILSVLLMGCQGTADLESTNGTPFDLSVADSGTDARTTPTPIADAGTDTLSVADVPPDDPCFAVPCGANASCTAGVCACNTGFIGDANAGCTAADPCASVTCAYGATCRAGVCACDAGFDPGPNDTCVAQSPGDTAARTQAEVCNRWNTDRVSQSQQVFQVDPTSSCDLGTLHPDTITDALRRTTLFRWLVGLPAVTSNPGQQENVQSCATTLAASNRGLSHALDDTYTCFTPAAATGAGSSNLAQGVARPADSVNLYVGDNGVRSLGHRRWVLNPRMGSTAFGQRDSYGCMYAFDASGSANPLYVAYPSPGFFPRGLDRILVVQQLSVAPQRDHDSIDDAYGHWRRSTRQRRLFSGRRIRNPGDRLAGAKRDNRRRVRSHHRESQRRYAKRDLSNDAGGLQLVPMEFI